jgi:hypothetical protein
MIRAKGILLYLYSSATETRQPCRSICPHISSTLKLKKGYIYNSRNRRRWFKVKTYCLTSQLPGTTQGSNLSSLRVITLLAMSDVLVDMQTWLCLETPKICPKTSAAKIKCIRLHPGKQMDLPYISIAKHSSYHVLFNRMINIKQSNNGS